MDHLYPGVLEPVQEVIENLLTLPQKCRKPKHRDCSTGNQEKAANPQSAAEKEALLENLERALAEKAGILEKKEAALQSRRDAGRICEIPLPHILYPAQNITRTNPDVSLYAFAESVRHNGILRPLTIQRMPKSLADAEEHYTLLAGERRLRAAYAAGLNTVPCIVLENEPSRMAALALIENLQRGNLDMFSSAASVASLLDIGSMTHKTLAAALQCSPSAIANKLRILNLTEAERQIIRAHSLTERHARAFLRIRDAELRLEAVRMTAKNRMTVAQTEAYMDELLEGQGAAAAGRKPEESPAASSASASAADAVQEPPQQNPNRKLILKDFRLFFNSIDRAVELLREAGIPVSESRTENADGDICISLNITPKPKTPPVQMPTSDSVSSTAL